MKRIGSGTDMKINRMAVVQGLNLETVPGQLRYGCSMTDFEDFYDIAECVNEKAHLLKRKGILPMAELNG